MTTGDRSPEVIGFGALNLDLIASAAKLSTRVVDLVRESTARFEWGSESAVDERVVHQAIERLGTASLDATLGGSAWNVIHALAQMRLGLRLGYVGFVGRVEIPGLSFLRQMDLLGIDRRFVGRDPDAPCGMCLSYIEDGERVLLTHPGANAELADHVERNLEELARYMAGALAIHVTSFLDDRTPDRAVELLQRVKELNPAVAVHLDPGHAWAIAPSPAVQRLLRLTDRLLVNYREFKALGRYSHGEPDESVAAKLIDRCDERTVVVVPKRYDMVEIFRHEGDAIVQQRVAQEPMQDEDAGIEDATGAGDAFAAGLLAAVTSRRLQLELGAFLGMSLVRHRLRHRSTRGHEAFPDLAAGFLQAGEDQIEDQATQPRAVFIAHGVDLQWQLLRQFIEEECHLPVRTYEPGEPTVDPGVELSGCLERCSFAACVLTARDQMSHGAGRAGQHIIHQAGLFHGRHGFGRVAMLVEEGCELFSNVGGLLRLDFPRGEIDTTFWRLRRMLSREGLLS